jgi:acetyl-CoA carboxylase biotin carboxyl carrier protein
MSETPTEPPDDPQVRRIRHLVRLMQRFDLTAIDLDDTTTKIRLRRRGVGLISAAGESMAPPAVSSPLAMAAPAATTAAPPPAPAPVVPKGVFIESPMVGTFYASPSPEAPPFVNVGSVIRQDSTVCIIEAMKVFTDIPAGITGTIVEVLVKNGQPVEFGQPLFRVEPS